MARTTQHVLTRGGGVSLNPSLTVAMNFEFFSVFFLARQKKNLAGREGYWTDDDGDEREGYWTNDDGIHLILF